LKFNVPVGLACLMHTLEERVSVIIHTPTVVNIVNLSLNCTHSC